MIRAKNAFAAPLIAVVLLLVLAAAAHANTIVVNVTDDPSGSATAWTAAQCSLRQAVDAASSGDTIQLADSTYSLTQGTNIEISKSLTIAGNGVDASVIDGSGNGQVADLADRRRHRADPGSAITNGIDGNDEAFQSCSPCETINANGGGALFNDGGNVTLDNVAFTNNSRREPAGRRDQQRLRQPDHDRRLVHQRVGDSRGAFFVRGGNVSGHWRHDREQRQQLLRRWRRLRAGRHRGPDEHDDRRQRCGSALGGGIANGGANLDAESTTRCRATSAARSRPMRALTTSRREHDHRRRLRRWHRLRMPARREGGPTLQQQAQSARRSPTTTATTSTRTGTAALTATSDIADADPHLASIADNGGPTRTQALLAGSQAIDTGNPDLCPTTDQRDSARDGVCDIGAFEANPIDPPSIPTSGAAENITDSSADLTGTINLSGDAGGFHFIWGLSPNDLAPQPDAGPWRRDRVGRHIESQTLSSLSPGPPTTTRSSPTTRPAHSHTADNVKSFTTQPDPPSVSNAFAQHTYRHERRPVVHDQPRRRPHNATSSSTATEIRATTSRPTPSPSIPITATSSSPRR